MKARILWLDDSPQKIKFWVNKLRYHYHVDIAQTFIEAETALREEPAFQLVILDLMIPPVTEEERQRYPGSDEHYGIKGGLAFYRKMKQEHLLDPSKVIIFTVGYEPDIHEEFEEEGLPTQHFLTKEEYNSADKFLFKVKELLDAEA